ncbi:MAG TPA: NADPH-dependent assimilatory sulfite reductase hemoprotein subunit [Candidatus Sulfotelmatobacter sp.]|jgi:sulfite reductase (NADPH) hemoprotein beta-component|nr:NADPH-dependent assimilatory sulfite reductase hemoprotein subunit [Candidatus Sulfotelmatobacter sp.]
MSDVPGQLTHNEELKTAIPTLAGTIAATLANTAADSFSGDDNQFLKFHGCYQQDDRDVRAEKKKFIMMVRGRIPGGVMTTKQWLVFDELAWLYANNTLRITTRQSIQFHGIVKANLRGVIKKINECLLSTLAACGDVNRNVLAPPIPAFTKAREEVYRDCVRVADALRPETRAYYAIWIDGFQLKTDEPFNQAYVDPLYGKTYLPRKFKVAFAIPPLNDVDIYTNCLGFVAIVENDRLLGYNLVVGGGMGRSHNNKQTYPRLASELGFFTPDKLVDVAKAVLTIHRDYGDRTDRKHARLKYVVEERGADWTRAEVEKRADIKLAPAKPGKFTTTADILDWHKAVDGTNFFSLFVENGRVKNEKKIALREIAEKFPQIEFRLTTNQNVILANVSDADKAGINAIFAAHKIPVEKQATILHTGSMACPALPTCGLALAESERALPGIIDRIEKLAGDLGLGGEEITIRSTGCPNGCARPYMAEIGFVGKAPGRYQVWLGGDASGTRLNRIWKETLKDADMEKELQPVLARFAKERNSGERFGDWCDRVVLNEQKN